jgi:hypothetical protein
MSEEINNINSLEFLKEVGNSLGYATLEVIREIIRNECEKSFAEAKEIGIKNTIAALYNANVKDSEIVRVTCEQWELVREEVEDRLIYEKIQAPKRNLEKYLKLQGYTSSEIDKLWNDYNIGIKIRHNKELWKLKDTPEKLLNEVKKRNK